jgi:hypothetical protein
MGELTEQQFIDAVTTVSSVGDIRRGDFVSLVLADRSRAQGVVATITGGRAFLVDTGYDGLYATSEQWVRLDGSRIVEAFREDTRRVAAQWARFAGGGLGVAVLTTDGSVVEGHVVSQPDPDRHVGQVTVVNAYVLAPPDYASRRALNAVTVRRDEFVTLFDNEWIGSAAAVSGATGSGETAVSATARPAPAASASPPPSYFADSSTGRSLAGGLIQSILSRLVFAVTGMLMVGLVLAAIAFVGLWALLQVGANDSGAAAAGQETTTTSALPTEVRDPEPAITLGSIPEYYGPGTAADWLAPRMASFPAPASTSAVTRRSSPSVVTFSLDYSINLASAVAFYEREFSRPGVRLVGSESFPNPEERTIIYGTPVRPGHVFTINGFGGQLKVELFVWTIGGRQGIHVDVSSPSVRLTR